MSFERCPDFRERQYVCRNTMRYWTSIVIVAQLNKTIDRNQLSKGLRSHILENGWITQNLFKEFGNGSKDDQEYNGHNWIFRTVRKIRFLDVVEYVDGHIDDAEYSKLNEITMKMDNENLPLWKVFVYEDQEKRTTQLCGVFDHSIFDGLAASYFIRDLVKNINKAHLIDPLDEVPYSEILFDSEMDSNKIEIQRLEMDTNVLFEVSTFYKIKKFFTFYYDKIIDYFYPPNPSFSYLPTSPDDIHNVYRQVKIPNCSRIINYCRKQGFTLTPFINAVGVKALQEAVFKPLDISNYDSILCIAVNGRPYCGINPQPKYGVLVGFDLFRLSTVDNLKQASMTLFQKLTNSIKYFDCFYMLGMYKVGNIWKAYGSKFGQMDKSTLTISNLGKYVDSEATIDDIYKVEDIWFALNTGLVCHFLFNVISNTKGELNVHLGACQQYSKYMDDLKEEFISIMEKELLEAGF